MCGLPNENGTGEVLPRTCRTCKPWNVEIAEVVHRRARGLLCRSRAPSRTFPEATALGHELEPGRRGNDTAACVTPLNLATPHVRSFITKSGLTPGFSRLMLHKSSGLGRIRREGTLVPGTPTLHCVSCNKGHPGASTGAICVR